MTPHEKILDFYSRLLKGEIAQVGETIVIQFKWQHGAIAWRSLIYWPNVWEHWQVDNSDWAWVCRMAIKRPNIIWLPSETPQPPPVSHVRKVEL